MAHYNRPAQKSGAFQKLSNLPGETSTTAENKAISSSVSPSALTRSPNSNMHSNRKRPFCELSTASDLRRIWPFKQYIFSDDLKSTANRTSSASNTPAFSRVTWSSLGRLEKPGSLRANCTTPRIAGENESLICVESGEAGADRGFRGQVCGKEKEERSVSLGGIQYGTKSSPLESLETAGLRRIQS